MSGHQTTTAKATGGRRQQGDRTKLSKSGASSRQVCAAPSCWEKGSHVEIDGDDTETAPVLCETHRKCYLGVST